MFTLAHSSKSFFCRIAFVGMIVCASLSSQGQITKSLNGPRPNDRMDGNVCLIKDHNKTGKDILWDFSDATINSKISNLKVIKAENTVDTILFILSGERQYLCNQNDTLKLVGTENITHKVLYDNPINKLVYPMEYGDSIDGYFYGRGRCYDRYTLRTIGKYKTKIDACGKMILPGNEILRDVVKLTTTKIYCNFYYQTDSISLPREDYSDNEIEKLLDNDSNSIVDKETSWYAKGYRYPIIQSNCTYSTFDKSISETLSYYFPTCEQKILPIDKENMDIRNDFLLYDCSDYISNNGDKTDNTSSFSYEFRDDKSLHEVTISTSAETPIDLEVILASVSGIVYKTIKKSNIVETDIVLNYSNLPRGQYAVYINVGLDVFTEKFDN